MEKIDPILFCYESKPASPLVTNMRRFSPRVFLCQNETNLSFFEKSSDSQELEQNLAFFNFPFVHLTGKFQPEFLESLSQFLNKTKSQKQFLIVNWNRQIFRDLMLQFNQNKNQKTENIENLFQKGFFTSRNDFEKFEEKNRESLEIFFKKIQENPMSENCEKLDTKEEPKDEKTVFIVQEFLNIWSLNPKAKPNHKISICKNPKNILKNFKKKPSKCQKSEN